MFPLLIKAEFASSGATAVVTAEVGAEIAPETIGDGLGGRLGCRQCQPGAVDSGSAKMTLMTDPVPSGILEGSFIFSLLNTDKLL
jgi:hypothetical protein